MKTIQKIVLSVIVITAFVLFVALFLPKEYMVQREIVINRPSTEVFDYIKYLRNQHQFNVWTSEDPHTKSTFSGRDGTIGFVSAWENENGNINRAEQEIVHVIEGKSIDTQIRLYEPYETVVPTYMLTDSLETNKTKVLWGMKAKMPYPRNITLLFYNAEAAVGKDLEKSLHNLKRIMEVDRGFENEQLGMVTNQ